MTSRGAKPTQQRVSRPTPWKIADLIDFECLLAGDTGAEQTRWRGRLPDAGDDAEGRRRLFKAWLYLRRGETDETLPGKSVEGGWSTLLALSLVAGTTLGASVTGALLHYKGAEPVNVSWFLACTVGVQMLVLAAAFALWLLRALTDWFDDFHPLRGLLAGLVWACSFGLRRLPGERRERLRASLAVLGRKREIYGSLAVWPLLIVTQLFAVTFNLGILSVLVAYVSTTDLAFAWQSTLHLGPEAAYRLVSALAAPWAWCVPNAHPTLAQVIASRFSYSEGIAPLDRAAMASWWPFLCYAVAFYGLLVRGALLIFAAVKLRAGLRGLTFDHEGCNALFRRLTGPVVQAQAGTAALEIPAAAAPFAAHAARGGACLALVAADVELPAEQPAAYIGKAFGWRVMQTLPVQIDHPSGNADALAALCAPIGEAGSVPYRRAESVVIVVRARRAPIKAIALFLQKVADAAGAKTEVILLLVGRKDGAGFARVEDGEFAHWKNFQAIHGLRLSLEKWSPA